MEPSTAVLALIVINVFSIISDASAKDFFAFSSGVEEYDTAYQLATTEIEENIKDGIFIAGEGWAQLWTRDTSYAVELAAGLTHPEIAQKSLEACTETDSRFGTVWLQDECDHFGGWPNLSDAIVGAQGAWSLFLVTGDLEFLSWAYEITLRSLARGERDAFDSSSGLFLGCSSFMESNSGYPSKYERNGDLVGRTKALSTNVLYYTGYKLAAYMGKELGELSEVDSLNEKAEQLRENIRSRLWLADEGYYSYFEDETGNTIEHMEGLGESLAILAPEFEGDAGRLTSIFENTHRTNTGLPCLWPRFDITENPRLPETYYHNGRLWPFVQGYWAVAAARHNQVDAFAEEFTGLVSLSLNANTFAEFYELNGTYLESRRRQLWSDTGFVAMVFHGLFGLRLLTDGIQFDPVKPLSLVPGDISLKGVKYRDMTLDIYVKGSGTHIISFELDGQISENHFISADVQGTHEVNITLDENALTNAPSVKPSNSPSAKPSNSPVGTDPPSSRLTETPTVIEDPTETPMVSSSGDKKQCAVAGTMFSFLLSAVVLFRA